MELPLRAFVLFFLQNANRKDKLFLFHPIFYAFMLTTPSHRVRRISIVMWSALFFVLSAVHGFCQTPSAEQGCSEAECKAHLQYLASDKLLGRMTGTAGNDSAAMYITRHFKACGLEVPFGLQNFLQIVPLVRITPPKTGKIILGGDTATIGSTLIPLFTYSMRITSQAVYVGFGVVDSSKNRDDYKGVNVRGKFVVVKYGSNDSSSLQQGAGFVAGKRRIAAERGALGVIELITSGGSFGWGMIQQFMGNPRPQLAEAFDENPASKIGSFMINDNSKKIVTALEKNPQTSIIAITDGSTLERPISYNVIGIIKGTDPKLRNEHVMLSAHFDHVGTTNRPGLKDTIYNGARDNGMGTTALLGAAKAISNKPLARSVIVAAWTGEEMGLLGSRHYGLHPVMSHDKIIYNLNADGAGFSDTTLVTVIGLDRTSAEPLIRQAAKAQGLTAILDPAPEQNLFDRSDNVSLAEKGIPAPTFSPGFRAFDAEIGKYYHQPADEAGEDFNFRYLTRYVNAFVGTARLIGDAADRPRWKVGDKYESAFKKLYGEK